MVLDRFASLERHGRYLPVLYPAPLLDGDDLFVVENDVGYTPTSDSTRRWRVKALHRDLGQFLERWKLETDWQPVPGVFLQPPYQCALAHDILWAPAAGGAILQVRRDDGSYTRLDPFADDIDQAAIFATGSPAVDSFGNVYYHAIQLDSAHPWSSDVRNAWLVRIGADGSVSKVAFAHLTAGAPGPSALCTTFFQTSQLPFPPSPDARAPSARCGSQRPPVNATPAVADSGVVYTISRAHFNDRWAYLVAVGPTLEPIWTASLRNRFNDGCGVGLPPNGDPGGCRIGAIPGVDPEDNQSGSARVIDDSTASPVIAPNGDVLYAVFTRYNHSQGHLMTFGADGKYLGAYPAGWDSTPAIYTHDGTFSVIFKENHYNLGSYCNDDVYCPTRTEDPRDPEAYFVTQLDSTLQVEWRFQNTSTESCSRDAGGDIQCIADHPNGFDWCVSAIAVDRAGVVLANNSDGNLYAIAQGGHLRDSLLIDDAQGAAYSPVAIDREGRVYTLSGGKLFVVVDQAAKRRAVRH